MAETEEGTTTVETTVQYIEDPIVQTEKMKKLFVGGIPDDCKEDELKSFFEGLCDGVITDQTIVRKEKKSFGFLTFEKSGLIDEILLKRKELLLNGKTLDVNRAVPKDSTAPGAREKTKKLFIANLPKADCTEEDLKKFFEERHDPKYGTIESVQLIKKKDKSGNKTEENKGFGFVMVSSEDMADKMAIQHASFEFGGRKIELKKSVPTEPGQNVRGGRGARGGGRGAPRGGRGGIGQFGQVYGGFGGGYSPYGGYGGAEWGMGYGGYGGYDAGYGTGYPQFGSGYGNAMASPRGGRGGARGRGQRPRPY